MTSPRLQPATETARSAPRRLAVCTLALAALAAAMPAAEAKPAARPAAKAAGDAPAPAWVWWEGEAPTATTLNNGGFPASSYPQRREGLSGGDWLANNAVQGDVPLHATYQIDVPADGAYTLWSRKFWKHGAFRFRFGQGAWQQITGDVALADRYELAKHIEANWVNCGRVELKKGPQEFRLELTGEKGKEATACFDAFLLTPTPFQPNGKAKPGEKTGKADAGWWAFEPEMDPYRKDALLDLRHLNEKVAGENGWIAAKGDGFVDGKGRPVRFWAVNWVSESTGQSHEEIDYMAARMAKSGVNLVRFHHNIFDDKNDDGLAIDAKYLDELQYCVSALKKQGVYTDISWYYVLGYGRKDKTAHGLPGFESFNQHLPFGLLFFEPRMQEMWRAWAKKMLEAPNKYTGVPLGKDPAVAVVEITNEDNLLFHTFGEKFIPEPYLAKLEKRFGAWLAKKHGSLEQALAGFAGQKCGRDDAAGGRAELMPAWNMSREGALKYGDDKKKRMQAQVEFLSTVQREWFAEGRRYLKEDLGYQGMVLATGWTTADNAMLDGLERWTYTAGDIVDKHGYHGGGDVGINRDFKMQSALWSPPNSPLATVHEAGRPHTVTETLWFKPNPRTAEMAYLWATYGGMQGMDGIYYFTAGSTYWNVITSNIPAMVPSLMCQPAYALQYRRGDVQEAPVVMHQVLSLESQFALEGCTAFGENADRASRPSEQAAANPKVDPLTAFVGRVTRRIAPEAELKAEKPVSQDVSKHIDRAGKKVTSITGECAIDYGKGVSTVDTPRSQGACGFLSATGTFPLKDVTIESRNEYGTVHVISLDDKPIAQSRRLLVQAFTEEKAYGWEYQTTKEAENPNAREYKVTSMGTAPLNIREIAGTVTFKAPFTKATALDENGYARAVLPDKGAKLTLPKDALFVIVER